MSSPILKALAAIVAGYFLSVCVVAGLPWYYFVGFSFIVAVTILFVRYPKNFLIYLLLFRAAIDPALYGVRFSLAGMDLGLGGSLPLLLIAGSIFAMIGSKRNIPQPISTLWAIFCLINIAAFFYTFDKGDWALALIRYFSVFSIFILSFICTESEEDAAAIVRVVIYSGAFTILGGLAYHFFQKDPGERFAATLGHPNILAFYLLILLGALFSGAGDKSGKQKKIFFYILFLGALVFTRTRSGWLAVVIMVVFYAIFFKRKLLLPGVIGIAALGTTPFIKKHIENAFIFTPVGIQVNEYGSLGWRLEKWSYLWKGFLEAPLTGHGIGSTVNYGKDALGAHNDYLRFLVETGIFGMVFAFLPYFYVLFVAIGDLHQTKHILRRNLAKFVVIFVPSFLVMSFSENLAGYIVIHWYLWAILGAYFALRTRGISKIRQNL